MGSGGKGGQRRKPPAKSRPANRRRPTGSGRTTVPRAANVPSRSSASRGQSRKRWKLLALGLVASLALLSIGLLINADERDRAERVLAALTAGDCRFDDRADAGRKHVEEPTYDVDPPAGGDHTPTPAPAGVYAEDDIPPDGDLVHSLEHGFIVLWYQPGIASEELDALVELHEASPGSTLVMPRESLDVPVAATAWHRRLPCSEGVEPEPLRTFIATYRNKAPEQGRPPAFPSTP